MKSLLIPLLLFVAFPLKGEWSLEQQRIELLLVEISKVEGVFIRNGTEHPPLQAVDHLRTKLQRAMSSWFAPDKEDWTAEMFIDKLASKSSLSGKPYQIRFNSGITVNTHDWLLKKLKNN
jgi:Family of unknown function (DUF5329)